MPDQDRSQGYPGRDNKEWWAEHDRRNKEAGRVVFWIIVGMALLMTLLGLR